MKEKIYSIGIDVSKKTLDICFLGSKNAAIKEFKVNNTEAGITEIIQKLKNYSIEKDASFLLESTSSYHVLSALLLIAKGYSVKVFNPIINNKYSKGCVRKCKTDKIDAKRIAEIGIMEDLPETELTKDIFFIRKKIAMLATLTKQKQVIKASLQQYSEDCNKLNESPSSFYSSAKASLLQLEKTIKELEKEIESHGQYFSGYDLIMDIKGVSGKSASIILSYISDKKFKSKYALTAFAGLDISTKESGTSVKGRGRISKRGNRLLRKTLTQVAWGLMMHNKAFKKLAEYYKAKGKHYFEIMVIIARKLLHIIYGMLKNNSQFDSAKIVIPSII